MNDVRRRLTAVAMAAAAGFATLAVTATTAPAAQAAGVPRCAGQKATIVGTPRADRLRGTPKRDVIVARGGDDVVRGLRGNDVICGGPGDDRLLGQGGSDELYGQRGADTLRGGSDRRWDDRGGSNLRGDTLDGGPGGDYLAGGFDPRAEKGKAYLNISPDTVSFRTASRGVRVDLAIADQRVDGTALGAGHDTIHWQPVLGVVGSRHDDRIAGGHVAGEIWGLRGDDSVTTYLGGRSVDTGTFDGTYLAVGGPGRDTVTPQLFGDRGVYRIDAADGSAAYSKPTSGWEGGRAWSDVYRFERWDLRQYHVGRVRFDGSDRADTVTAGRAPLAAAMRRGDDVVRLGAGRDSVDGGAGSDTVTGARAGDSCTGVERGDCG